VATTPPNPFHFSLPGSKVSSLPCTFSGANKMPERAVGGRGVLKAINGSELNVDLVVIDAATGKPVRSVLVCAHRTVELSRLTIGTYRILFDDGDDCFDFNKVLSFEEIELDNGIQYDKHTITLNPVPDGNVEGRRISRAEFLASIGAAM
jgi:hypothetical protein